MPQHNVTARPPVRHKSSGLTVAAEGWESPGERWFYAFYVTVLEQLIKETEKND